MLENLIFLKIIMKIGNNSNMDKTVINMNKLLNSIRNIIKIQNDLLKINFLLTEKVKMIELECKVRYDELSERIKRLELLLIKISN